MKMTAQQIELAAKRARKSGCTFIAIPLGATDASQVTCHRNYDVARSQSAIVFRVRKNGETTAEWSGY